MARLSSASAARPPVFHRSTDVRFFDRTPKNGRRSGAHQ
jgi:hypothetical protein